MCHTLRGFDARLIFVDEAAFVGGRMFTAGILPVAQQKFTCTVMTTTPGPPQSYIMQQAKKVDLKGNPLMPCLLLGEPCADCKAKNEYICPHTTEKGPFWKSASKRSAFGFFYESDKETDAMENYNAVLQSTSYGFLAQYIERLSRMERFKDTHKPRLMVMSADACGGGNDEFAITAGYRLGDRFVITFMDSERVPGANLEIVERRLFTAIEKVRGIKLFNDVPILFVPENAPGPIGATFQYLINQEQTRSNGRLGKICTMREYGKDRKYGVPKTAEITDQMLRYASTMMRYGKVQFSENLRGGLNTTAPAMIDKLLKQMAGYRCEVKYNKNDLHAVPKFKWMGDQDDLLVSFMEALYWEAIFWDSSYEGYERFKKTL